MALIDGFGQLNLSREITPADIPLPPALPDSDQVVLDLVLKDLNRAEYYLLAKGMSVEWDADDRLYLFRVPQGFWEGSSVPRASLGVPLIYEHVESLMPQLMSALFSDNPPFEPISRPKTKQEAARASKEIINYQLDEMNFREELRKCCKELLIYGTCFAKKGWKRYNKTIRETVRTGTPTVELVNGQPVQRWPKDSKWKTRNKTITVNEPYFKCIHVRYIIPDPKVRCPKVNTGAYVIERQYMGVEDLEKAFRKVPGNKLPDTATLQSYFTQPKEAPERSMLEGRSTTSIMNTGISSLDLNMEFKAMPRYQENTADPNKQQLEVLEYTTEDNHYVVLNRKLPIIVERNTFGEINYDSCCFTDVPDSLYGIGLGRLLKGEQRLQQGIINGRLDDLSLRLSGSFIRVRGSNTPAQQMRLRPGGIIDTDDADGIKMIEYPPALADAFTEVEASDSRAQRRSGANELITQGGQQGPSSITRTATGMNALAAGVGARLGYLIDFISDLLFVPALEFFQECNSKWLDEDTIGRILTDELQQAYDGDMLDIVNAKLKFRILASAKAKARQALAQNLMPMLQVFQQQPVIEAMGAQGMKVDWVEIAQAVADISEIAGTQKWVVPMTDDDKKRMMQKNEFMQQAAMQQFQHNNEMQQIKATGDSQLKTAMGKEIVKGVVEGLKAGFSGETGDQTGGGSPSGGTGEQ